MTPDARLPINAAASREQWAAYREDALEREEIILPLRRIDRWHPFVANAPEANLELRSLYLELHNNSFNDRSAWENLEASTHWRGILVPHHALEDYGIHRLRAMATAVEFWRRNIGFAGFLRDNFYAVRDNRDQPAALPGLWNYVLSYHRMVQRARTQGAEVGVLKRGFGSSVRFPDLLPSGQVIELLLRYALRGFARHWDAAEHRRLLASAHPTVQEFFATTATLDDALAGRPGGATEAAFYTCCAADVPFVTVQEVLDNASGKKLLAKLPAEYRARFAAGQAPPSLGERLQRFVGRINILDRARLLTEDATTSHDFGTPRRPLAASDATKWYDIDPEELTALLAEVGRQPELLVAGRHRWQNYLRDGLQYLTSPFLTWTRDNDLLVPQWDTPAREIVDAAAREHESQRRRILQEKDRIKSLLPALRRTTTMDEIRNLERKRAPFETATARGRWSAHLDRQRQVVRGQRMFRQQKMEEFGFRKAKFKVADHDRWLDELLKVEREVRPYMAYVRKAFQAALPVGSTIEFNPFRHRHDGVEFDPDTVQDQDKWLRGDVMKTLRSRRNYAPISQVNVFCLDFSRSMNHDLMRNLFKVVFLLVTGLEGRETYDAIHFFGSEFREAVSFTDAQGYTSKAVLAKILAHVATIEQGSVVYSGFGGTNISSAVEESHHRIEAFSERLEQEEPDIRFVKSILILTDGQPTVGIINLDKLRDHISGFRDGGDVSIKGIYLKHPEDQSDFMSRIFGPMDSVEASSFEELIASFVQTMSLTYRRQRKEYRAAQKRKRLLGQRVDDT